MEVDYSKMTNDEFVDCVQEVASDCGTMYVLQIPGVWEIVSEYFNNAALDLWASRQESDHEQG